MPSRRYYNAKGEPVRTEAEAAHIAVCYEESDRGWRRSWEWARLDPTYGLTIDSTSGPDGCFRTLREAVDALRKWIAHEARSERVIRSGDKPV